MKRCWFPFNWEYFSLTQNERNLWTAIQLHQNLANSSAHFSRDYLDVQSYRPPQFGNAQGNYGTNHRFLAPGDIQICTSPSGFPARLFIYYGKIPDLPQNQKTCRHLMFTPRDEYYRQIRFLSKVFFFILCMGITKTLLFYLFIIFIITKTILLITY